MNLPRPIHGLARLADRRRRAAQSRRSRSLSGCCRSPLA